MTGLINICSERSTQLECANIGENRVNMALAYIKSQVKKA